MSGLSLRQKLPILASTVAAGAFVIASVLVYFEVGRSARTAAETRLSWFATEVSTLLDERLSAREDLLQQAASSRAVRQALTTSVVDVADVRLQLSPLRGPEDGTLPVMLLRPDGSEAFSIGAGPGDDDPDPTPPLEAETAIGPVRQVHGHLLYWETFPATDADGRKLGWIAQRHRVGPRSMFDDVIDPEIRLRVGKIGDDIWLDLEDARAEAAPGSLALGVPYVLDEKDGSRMLAMGRRIGDTPWIAVLDIPMSRVLARPHAIRLRLVTFGSVLVLGVVFFAWLGSRRLTNPLEDLAGAAEAIARGDYDRRVRPDRDDELGRLGEAFNTMAGRVQSSEATLQRRLTEAKSLTRELETARSAAEHAREAAVRAREEAELAREEAQTANQAKADILAAISHDIRTPVSAVLSYTELLESGAVDEPTDTQRRYLSRIRDSTQMIVSLADDVLDFACIETGMLRVEIGIGSVDQAIRTAVRSIEPRTRSKGISLTSESPEGSVFLGDPRRVQQILMNLLTNAVKFTPDGGQVAVRCWETCAGPAGSERPASGRVAIEVEDTGVGIPAGELEGIFEPFSQGEESKAQGGVGLGLAISRHLARVMSGEITVHSTVGEGSRFTLWLPAAAPDKRTPTHTEARWRRSGERTAEAGGEGGVDSRDEGNR